MKAHVLFAAVSILLCQALLGAVKPLAVWNGEFYSRQESTRNGVTFIPGSVSFKGQSFEIKVNDGAKFKAESGTSMGQAIIANISGIAANSTSDRVLFGCLKSTGSSSEAKYWQILDRNGRINAERIYSYGGFATTASKDDIDFGVQHSFGMFVTHHTVNSYGTLDGVPVHTNNLFFSDDANTLKIGTWTNLTEKTRYLNGASVSYVAIFPDDANLTLEDFKTWSLHEMTRAETATNVTAAAVAEDAVLKGGGGVGINLLGGTYKIEGATGAHALFVQESSTLEFSDSASLTLAGPVYIASGRELTLTLADGAAAASLKAKHFADASQIRAAAGIRVPGLSDGEDGEGCVLHNFTAPVNIPNVSVSEVKIMASDENGEIEERFDITSSFSVTDDGAGGVNVAFAPEVPKFESVIVEEESVKPMQFVGDDIVFGVKTTPGLWYAAVAGGDIEGINASTTPDTEPFMATAEGAKITAPKFVPPLMFYKVIVAPSKAAFGE